VLFTFGPIPARLVRVNSVLSLLQKYQKWLFAALVIHLVAAFFSTGFHHYDEHFCLYEFAFFKMGKVPLSQMPWDFTYMLRPWLPVGFFILMVKTLSALGIDSPFAWAFGIRLFSAILGWLCIVSMVPLYERWIKEEWLKKWAVIFSCVLWFLPYIHARPSQESWSSSFFFLGFALLFWRDSITSLMAFLVGILWGLSFETRYQAGLLIFFGLLWCLVIGRVGLRVLGSIVAGGLVVFAVSLIADHWGYGVWTFAGWNYLRNQVFEGMASASGGVNPWYAYLTRILWQGGFPLSLFIITGAAITWLRYPTHPITWITAPFFIIHCLLGHKETRYLFPLAPAVPLLIFMALNGVSEAGLFDRKTLFGKIKVGFIRFTIAVNGAYLIVVCLRPLRVEIPLYEYVYQHVKGPLYYVGRNPYELAGLMGYYYRSPKSEPTSIPSYGELASLLKSQNKEIWLFTPGIALPENAGAISPYCEASFQTIPPWLRTPLFMPIVKKTAMLGWSVYRCEPPGQRVSIR
jgi:GPI mannosyltransferase 3